MTIRIATRGSLLARTQSGHVAEALREVSGRDVELVHVRTHVSARAAQRVEPIVVSLRAHAEQVVEAELQRLRLRLPDLDDDAADEVARTLRRAVSTLLHTPTVRMKELAGDPDGTRYATALHRLFDLDPEAIEALSAAEEAASGDRSTAGPDPTVDDLLGGAT